MASNIRRLKSGYTTGACAAAASKAAAMLLLSSEARKAESPEVEIPFPDGSRVRFSVYYSAVGGNEQDLTASASVIKDAGDDPDVTNGAEIIAQARLVAAGYAAAAEDKVLIRGGRGVGTASKPGLPVAVGEPAINPVPRRMIREAVAEAVMESGGLPGNRRIEITISVPGGEELAKKTLNARLGIVGGISILGTSGIVKPLSSEAWTSSITASMDVARASGLKEIVLSVGRVSERAHMKKFAMPEEAYVMMGDYVEFSLADAKKHDFGKIHLSAHWAKMLKISMSTPQTHVRHGAIDISKGVKHLGSLGITLPVGRDFNTAREVYDYMVALYGVSRPMLNKVCAAARRYAEGITCGIPVIAHLVSYEGDIIGDSE